MKSLDVNSVEAFNLLTALICAAAILILWMQNRGLYRGIAFWAAGYLLHCSGALLPVLGGGLPEDLVIAAGISLSVGGSFFLLVGLQLFTERKIRKAHSYAAAALVVLVFSYFSIIRPNQFARIFSFSLVMALVNFRSMLILFFPSGRDVRSATRVSGAVFGIFSAAYLYRLVVLLTHPAAHYDAVSPTETLLILTSGLLFIAQTCSLTLIINRYLVRDLTQEKNNLAEVFSSLPQAATLSRAEDGRLLHVNESFLLMTGFDRAEVTGKTLQDLHFWMQERDLKSAAEKLSAGRQIRDSELRFRRKSGDIFPGLFSAAVRVIDNQALVLSTYSDLSGLALCSPETASLAKFPEENPNPVLSISKGGIVLYANHAGGAFLAEGDSGLSDRVPESIAGLLERAWSKGVLLQEEINIGSRSYIAAVTPIIGLDYLNLYAIDITDKKLLYAKYLHAQKMESIGLLTGGITHDFNNLITIILGYSHDLLSRSADRRTASYAEAIHAAGTRAAELTRQLLAYSRREAFKKSVIHTADLVKGTAKMLGRVIGETIALEIVTAPGTGNIEADPGQMEQVLLNLAINSRDAMPEGGRLTLETGNSVLADPHAAARIGVPPGRYVLICVTDTGIGMDEQTQARIFEPFFTTKPEGRGTGLGLSTVCEIVRQNGGSVQVQSERGKGTAFRIFLPECRAETRDQPVASPYRDMNGGKETILIAEDEESLLVLMQIALEEKGYTVLLAHDWEEALSLVEKTAGKIELLITDMIFPGMSGISLAHEFFNHSPESHVLLISGYSEQDLPPHDQLEGSFAFLPKPFIMDDIVIAVRRLLDNRETVL